MAASPPLPLLPKSKFPEIPKIGTYQTHQMGANLISDFDWACEAAASDSDFGWSLDGFDNFSKECIQIDGPCTDVCEVEKGSSRKRGRDGVTGGPKSKACREKMRRDKLNDRFVELGSIIEPGRNPKSDKAMILSDASRLLVQLRIEAQQLKETNEKLQETIKELKAEKNDLRDEKTQLKSEKEKLELQVKAMSMPPTAFVPMPHMPAIHSSVAAAFAAQSQDAANKMVAYPGFPGVAMWQWMPPAVVDTSQDHKLRPPVA